MAQEKPKPILEVTRSFQEEAFPGYTAFIANLSAIEALPSNWLAALRAARGIYLLTCPRTKEKYVGSDVLPKALPVITGVRGWYGADRKRDVWGKRVSVRVDHGGGRSLKKKKKKT